MFFWRGRIVLGKIIGIIYFVLNLYRQLFFYFMKRFLLLFLIIAGSLILTMQAYASQKKFFFMQGEKERYVPMTVFNQTNEILKGHGAMVDSEVIPETLHPLPVKYYGKIVDWFASPPL